MNWPRIKRGLAGGFFCAALTTVILLMLTGDFEQYYFYDGHRKDLEFSITNISITWATIGEGESLKEFRVLWIHFETTFNGTLAIYVNNTHRASRGFLANTDQVATALFPNGSHLFHVGLLFIEHPAQINKPFLGFLQTTWYNRTIHYEGAYHSA